MGLGLTDDLKEFQQSAREFADKEMLPYAAKWDEEEIFPVQVNVSYEKIINLVSLKKEFISYCRIDRYKAREIYEKSKNYNLYISFMEKDNTLFYRLMLIYNETKYFLYLK